MSGFEAAFGLAAGGAGLLSLSIQLGESAMKLKRLYNAASNAPRTVSRLVFDLETMAMALNEIEHRRQRSMYSDTILTRCITTCQQNVAEIQRLVGKMETKLANHSKVHGRVYTALKDRDIQDLCNDLERAKASLELAYMMYLAEEQRRRDQRHSTTLHQHGTFLQTLRDQIVEGNASISQQLTRVTAVRTLPPTSFKAPSANENQTLKACTGSSNIEMPIGHRNDFTTGHRRSNSPRTRIRARFNLPPWLCRRVWDFTMDRVQCGWTLNLRTYNNVSYYAPVFEACGEGDLGTVRALIAAGEATLLDRETMTGWTLLEVISAKQTLYSASNKIQMAAIKGHLHLCRFLLEQTTWPDHARVLNNALGVFTLKRESRRSARDMYQLFLDNPGFDIDFDAMYSSLWLIYCAEPEIFEVIVRSQIGTQSAQARLELACHMNSLTSAAFLKCMGLEPTNPELALLRSAQGYSVLHLISRKIWNHSGHVYGFGSRADSESLQGWLDLGVQVLQNGADLCSLVGDRYPYFERPDFIFAEDPPAMEEDWKVTPLLSCICRVWQMHGYVSVHPLAMSEGLQTWIKMVSRAGIDLSEYGARESKVWELLSVPENRNVLHDREQVEAYSVEGFTYGPSPTDWSLQVRYHRIGTIYKLELGPGAYPKPPLLPSLVAWTPTIKEADEGRWMPSSTYRTVSRRQDLRSIFYEIIEPFNDIVDGTQDDTGAIMLMQYRATRSVHPARRSHSQPACLSRRSIAYCASHESQKHPWLPNYHLCPYNHTWRFGCVRSFATNLYGAQPEQYLCQELFHDGRGKPVFHVRSCVKGLSRSFFSAQESTSWGVRSFLSEIAACQHSATLNWRPDWLNEEHNGNDDCPRGCASVSLSALNVPEDLERYHPVGVSDSEEESDEENI